MTKHLRYSDVIVEPITPANLEQTLRGLERTQVRSVTAILEQQARRLMLRRVENLCRFLIGCGQEVQRIELFGSLARRRGGLESDFDLVIVTSDTLAEQWHHTLQAILDDDIYDSSVAAVRRELTLEFIGLDESEVLACTGVPERKMDLFLFPANWKHLLSELQEAGRHRDPAFMENIARDAVPYMPGHGFLLHR